MTVTRDNPDQDVEARAAAWFARLRSNDVSEQDQLRFGEWLAADARHIDAFGDMERRWHDASRLLVGIGHAGVATPRAIPVAAGARRLSAWKPSLVRAACLLPVMIALVLVTILYRPPTVYRAGDAPRAITLSDGSRISLDPGTEIRVVYWGDQRIVDLLHGRADFSVAAEPHRRFVVMAANGRLDAVASRFTVAVAPRGAKVAVTGGIVRLSVTTQLASGSALNQVILRVGQSISYAAAPHLRSPPAGSPAWSRLSLTNMISL